MKMECYEFANIDMEESVIVEGIAGGNVGVFSHRAPDKTSDNEDAAAVFSVNSETASLIVADGMGGMSMAAMASKIAIDAVVQTLNESGMSQNGLREAVLNGIEKANENVMNMGVGAGTTIAVIEIQGDIIRPYHIGDSAILVVGQRGKVKLFTTAHSPVGYAIESGMLNEEQGFVHEDRHLISNYIGTANMHIEIGAPLKLGRYDTLVIGSDGLYDNLSLDEIISIVRKGPLSRVTAKLREVCQKRMENHDDYTNAKPDDLTFIVYRRTA